MYSWSHFQTARIWEQATHTSSERGEGGLGFDAYWA